MMLRVLVCVFALLFVSATSGKFNDTLPLQLATAYQHSVDLTINEYYVSEKLDGIRARWTGKKLITRNGNIIHSPPWFTRNWPDVALDGELWVRRGAFEYTASIVLRDSPDERWRDVTFMVFDLPNSLHTFEVRFKQMEAIVQSISVNTLSVIPQFTLPTQEALQSKLDDIVAAGGEGLMLHHKQSRYKDGRSEHLLKLKQFQDAEAKVLAHIQGKGAFANLMGALLVETEAGVRFKLGSGFSHAERANPPAIGSWVTYKYYGLTAYGKPRFASFLHTRPLQDLPQ